MSYLKRSTLSIILLLCASQLYVNAQPTAAPTAPTTAPTAAPTAAPGPPIRFCRTQSRAGSYQSLDPFMQEGFTFWKEWVDKRGGINVGGVMRPVRFITYEDGSDPTIQQLLYQRLLTTDNCDFLFSPFASTATGVSLIRMFENGKGSIDTSLVLKQVPYMYRHGSTAQLLWRGQNWTWSFSMIPNGDNAPIPCIQKYAQAGARTAWILVNHQEAGFNATIVAVPSILQRFSITYEIKNLPTNLTRDEYLKFGYEMRDAAPDILVMRMSTGNTRKLLEVVRGLVGYNPKGVHLLGQNTLANPQSFYDQTLWTANQTTTATQWQPTDLFGDKYFGTPEELFNNLTIRFPNSTINEFHASAACSGLFLVMGIEETGSINPVVIRNWLQTFNRTTSYGPVYWLQAGELTSDAWQCIQSSDNKARVLAQGNQLIYPAVINIPPPPPEPPVPEADHTARNIGIIVGAVLGGLIIIGLIAGFIFWKSFYIITVPKNEAASWENEKE